MLWIMSILIFGESRHNTSKGGAWYIIPFIDNYFKTVWIDIYVEV